MTTLQNAQWGITRMIEHEEKYPTIYSDNIIQMLKLISSQIGEAQHVYEGDMEEQLSSLDHVYGINYGNEMVSNN